MKTARPWARPGSLVIGLGMLLQINAWAAPLQTSTSWSGASPELFIVPLLINGNEERGELILALEQSTGAEYIELAAFVEALNIGMTSDGDTLLLNTPIGTAQISTHAQRELDGRNMVLLSELAERLASPMHFDRQIFAVTVNPAWSLQQPLNPAEIVQPQVQADISASNANVSFLRNEILHRDDRNGATTSIITDTGGSLAGGYWQARVRDYIESDPFIEDYAWVRDGNNARYFLGNQTTSLNTLLGGFEFTGAQMAFTNRDIGLFTKGLGQSQFLANQRGSIRTFIGEGPPGGSAQLRIENAVTAVDTISLDGRFEFRDVELPSGGLVQIEVWLFERGNEGSPVDVQDFSGFNTNQTLPARTMLWRGGIGVDENLIESNREQNDLAAFMDTQYALTDQLTAQAIYQRQNNVDTGLAALHANFDSLGFVSAQVAQADGETGWRVELDNLQQHVFWRGFAQHQPRGWQGNEDKLDDVFAEAGYRFNERWQASLIGRDFDTDEREFDFLLPGLEWRPNLQWMLRARPDFDGDYTVQAFWRPDNKNDLSGIFNEDESSLQWVHQLSGRDNLFLQAVDRDRTGERLALTWRRAALGTRSLGWAVGALTGNGSFGFLLQADYEFTPGLRARAEALRDPFSAAFEQSADTVFTLSLVADFNLAGGISRGAFRRALVDRGVIAGRVNLPEAAGLQGFSLAQVAIMVDGQVRTRTEADGSFTINFMPPGLYRVKLDLDGLPLELHPQKDQFWVKVSAGAVSRVDFATELRLGFAGQVQGAGGCGLAEQALEILDSAGTVVAVLRSNRFGFYRVDGLAPGRYQVRLSSAAKAHSKAHTMVELRNSFVFGQTISTGLACPVTEDEQ